MRQDARVALDEASGILAAREIFVKEKRAKNGLFALGSLPSS
jgi:hypothetical protein